MLPSASPELHLLAAHFLTPVGNTEPEGEGAIPGENHKGETVGKRIKLYIKGGINLSSVVIQY